MSVFFVLLSWQAHTNRGRQMSV